jgi:hypothetical protein
MPSEVWDYPPPDGAFTPLNHTTAGRSAKLGAPSVKHADLIGKIIEHGIVGTPVVAVNCNFGNICQPGYECRLKHGAKEQPMAPAGHKRRQVEGSGGCFGSAVEPALKPPPDSAVYKRLIERNPKNSERVYAGLYFPTTGSTTFSGSVLPDYADAEWAIDEWVKFLNDSNVLGGPVEVITRGLIMTNSNFRLNRWCNRQVFNFAAMRRVILDHAKDYFPAHITISESQVHLEAGNDNGTFRMESTKHQGRKNLVKFYHGTGKVNFMGFPSPEFTQVVYTGLSRMFTDHWSELVAMKPRPDHMTPKALSDEQSGLQRALAAHLDMLAAFSAREASPAENAAAELFVDEVIADMIAEEQAEEQAAEDKAGLMDMMGMFAEFV